MFRKLVKTATVDVEDQSFSVRYYEARTMRGGRRFSAEVILGPADRIIIDDDTMSGLESKVARLVPATLYSRMLAGRITVAA
jgi:hypothetical protein